MTQNFGASVPSLWDGSDQTTDVIATIRLQFIALVFLSPVLSEDMKRKLFGAICPELQKLIDARFGSGIVHLKNAGVRAGSIEVWLLLVTVGGAVYTFFKDYEHLRKDVMLFVQDVQAIGSKLFTVIQTTYTTGGAHIGRTNVTNRGTLSH